MWATKMVMMNLLKVGADESSSSLSASCWFAKVDDDCVGKYTSIRVRNMHHNKALAIES